MADTPDPAAPPPSDEPPGSPSGVPLFDNQLTHAVRESAQQIWQAGLGAFAKAQGEGAKVFDTLVKEGLAFQHKTQTAAEEKITAATERLTRLSDDVQNKAGQQWDRLERVFEGRVAQALTKLGVPTRGDIDALCERIDALTAEVARLTPKRASGRSAAAKKVVAKKAPARKRATP